MIDELLGIEPVSIRSLLLLGPAGANMDLAIVEVGQTKTVLPPIEDSHNQGECIEIPIVKVVSPSHSSPTNEAYEGLKKKNSKQAMRA